jgi:CCR4-NOT transcription complex subunit 4
MEGCHSRRVSSFPSWSTPFATLRANISFRIAQFKAKVQKDAKKKAEARQKEAQKREVENLNRKHLAGLRVIQKNLVYVVGLSHGIPEQDLLQTLRGEKYFGQYGKIVKIVVSKAKAGDANSSLGVYVTFARKEDAARCIAAVNGSTNLDRVLRAQLGTTKYCSAYLRNETCTNKQCMFLHEPGDNEDSYSRQDLSSINSVGTQRPLASTSSSSRQAAQAQAPIQQAQPIAAASQPMGRESSKEGSDSGDGSALPSSASWANRGLQGISRRGSAATSGAAPSPAVSAAMPAPVEAPESDEVPDQSQEHESSDSLADQPSNIASTTDPRGIYSDPVLMRLLKSISRFKTCPTGGDDSSVLEFPPLFDDQGGLKRKALREQQEETRLHLEEEIQHELRSVSDAPEEEPESGSGQLGGEPEDRNETREGNTQQQGFQEQRRPSVQMPIQRAANDNSIFSGGLGQNYGNNMASLNGRNLTALQQQQLLAFKSSGQAQSGFMDQYPPGMDGLSQPSLFQQQGHNRQSSRYSFANDNSSTSVSAKVASTSRLGGMQSSMMPSQQGQFYSSALPGPPPGLKSTGTPPMSGGGMFGQTHGFGGSLGGSSAFGGVKENSSDMLREMLRNRGGMASGGQVHDAGKREFMFPSLLHQYQSASTPAPASGHLATLYGQQPGAFQDYGIKQKKKGKKHRHANTSSSGGGGLVDLADPNMFQARMPLQQQQSNAGAGHGLFGGQGQGGYSQNSVYGGFPRW